MSRLDLTTIILTYNEELHIRRCLENVHTLSRRTIVVDCGSTDRTCEICAEFADVEVVEHEWPGNQAAQFNWVLDNVEITTEWVLRLDADEYLTPELIEEMKDKLPHLSDCVSAVVLPLGRAFMGRVLKHGIVNGVKMIRLFRYGKVRYEQRLMDEHLEILEGESVVFENKFVDDSRLPIAKFIEKHNGYSNREAAMLLDAEFNLFKHEANDIKLAKEVATKRVQKAKYAKLPLFWRSFAYFLYRYILKGGFLDGKEGFLWDFLQGWWYRTLVDAKVLEVKRACGDDREKIKVFLKEKYNIVV